RSSMACQPEAQAGMAVIGSAADMGVTGSTGRGGGNGLRHAFSVPIRCSGGCATLVRWRIGLVRFL
ncbi:hypothetical protein, partial [Burkholderia sola]|uniref:hypothetical protein n=1 Tax=Burkholderia sola TaxID=2843302 RepID=UPI00338FD462